MSRAALLRFGVVVLMIAWRACAAHGQAPPKGGPARATGGGERKPERLVYDVKLGVAKDLADVLGKLFKADAGVQILLAPAGNALVISAPAKTTEEILRLLDKLDRRPRTVAVEVLVAEVSPHKGEEGKPAVPARALKEADFGGQPEEVYAKLQDLQKKGVLGSVERLRLRVTENHEGSVSNGVSRPYTTGIIRTARGPAARTVTYRSVGTQVKATARIGEDRRILLDLHVTATRMRVPEDSPVLGADEAGKPVRTTEFVNVHFDGSLLLSPGKAVAAKGVTTSSRSGQTQTLVIVSARLVEPEAKKGK